MLARASLSTTATSYAVAPRLTAVRCITTATVTSTAAAAASPTGSLPYDNPPKAVVANLNRRRPDGPQFPRKRGVGWVKPDRRPSADKRIGAALRHGGAHAAAVELYRNKSGAVSAASVTRVLQALGKAKAVEALTTFRSKLADKTWSRPWNTDTVVYNSLVAGLARSGAVDAAAAVVEIDMPAAGLTPDAYSLTPLVTGYCRAGRLDEALATVDSMILRGIKPTHHSVAAVIRAHGLSGNEKAAREFMTHMMSIGVAPTLSVLNALLHCYAVNGNLESVRAVWESLPGTGGPDAVSFTSLIRAYAEAGQDAWPVLEQMADAGVDPNAATYTVLLEASAKAVTEERLAAITARVTEKVFSEGGKALDSGVIGAIARASVAVQAGSVEVGGLIDKAELAGVRVPLTAFDALISAYATEGNAAGARAVLAQLPLHGLKPSHDTLSLLADAYEGSGDVGAAKRIRERLESVGVGGGYGVEGAAERLWPSGSGLASGVGSGGSEGESVDVKVEA